MLQSVMAENAAGIQTYFDKIFTDLPDLPVTHAMRYALRGGKAVRGFLVLESAHLHGLPRADALPAAAAIEAIHAYSLVHDDLPAMDDDDLRRGQPTVHRKWDDATAILAGDALQALGFRLVLDIKGSKAAGRLAAALANAAGVEGMVRGQALDIAAESAPEPLTLEQIMDLQAGKTGALIEWSAMVGPMLTAGTPDPMRQYGRALGLAFQIADDILDVEGDEAKAGKRLGKDADAGKATFVSLMGLDGAKARAADLVQEAQAALDGFGPDAETLRALARFVIARNN